MQSRCYLESGAGARFELVPQDQEDRIRLEMRPPRVRGRFLEPGDGDGVLYMGGSPTLDRTELTIEFLHVPPEGEGPGLFLTELEQFLLRNYSSCYVYDQRTWPHRRAQIHYESMDLDGETARSMPLPVKLKCVAPYGRFESDEHLAEFTAANGETIEIALVDPRDVSRVIPTHTVYPIWEISSAAEIKEFELLNLGQAAGAGERLTVRYNGYPPGYIYELDTYTRPGGSFTLRPPLGAGRVDVLFATDERSGYLRLYAGINRFQVTSPQGPLRIRCRYRLAWLR